MKNDATNEYPIHELIVTRWSPRAFSERLVSPEKVRSLLEAARWAPSSMNQQPWRFVVATREDGEAYQKLLSTLRESNRAWAKRAPVLMVAIARTHFDNGSPNRHAWHDVGLAVGQLSLQAAELGLSVHQMGGFYPERVREHFGVPDDYEPVSALAIGYPDEPDILDERNARRDRAPRERLSQKELVFGAQWGTPW